MDANQTKSVCAVKWRKPLIFQDATGKDFRTQYTLKAGAACGNSGKTLWHLGNKTEHNEVDIAGACFSVRTDSMNGAWNEKLTYLHLNDGRE